MDELEARFDGREIEDNIILEDTAPGDEGEEQKEQELEVEEKVILDRPRGDWKEVNEDEESSSDEIETKHNGRKKATDASARSMDADGKIVGGSDDFPREETDGAELDSADGDPLGADDVDGEGLDDNSRHADSTDDVDGTSPGTKQVILPRGIDGNPQNSKNNGVAPAQEPDGAILVLNDPNVRNQLQKNEAILRDESNDTQIDSKFGDDDDLDGEPVDGESIDGESIDGESIDGESIDGEAVQEDDLDGEAIDGEVFDEDLDGEAIDGEEIDGVDG